MNIITRILTVKARLKLRLINNELRDLHDDEALQLAFGLKGSPALAEQRGLLVTTGGALLNDLNRRGVSLDEAEMGSTEMLAWCFALVAGLILAANPFVQALVYVLERML